VGATGTASARRHIGLAQRKIALAEQSADPKGKPRSLWIAEPFQEVVALAVTPNAVIVAGVDRREMKERVDTTAAVTALGIADGKPLWKQTLPAPPVSWGLAVDRRGQVLVALQDGRVVCFGEAK
jgi:hypothetical protein